MAKSLVLNRTRKVPAEDTAAFGAIAERFRRAGALERAVELCREGLQKFPDHISARVTLGWSLLDLGKYEDARVELEQVLRRAPDNLAAIRGLAELHDRFEHTLHLPMDGPGQWPPPPDSMDEAGPAASAIDDDEAGEGLEMTPAALGIPIWSPAVSPAPPSAPPATAQAIQVTSVPATVASPPPAATVTAPTQADSTAPMPATAATSTPLAPAAPAHAAPAARAVSEPVKVEPAAAASSGMSSVREIDFANAASISAPTPAVEESPVAAVELREEPAETTEFAADAYAVSDADIQALIAEAESLDAVAVVTPPESESASVEGMALETEDLVSAMAEFAPATPAVSYSSVTEPISVDLDLNEAPGGIAGSLTVHEAAGAGGADYTPVEMSETEVFEAALEIAAPLVDAALEIEEPAQCAELARSEEPAQCAELARSEEPAQCAELARSEEQAQCAELARSEEPAPYAAVVQEERAFNDTFTNDEAVTGATFTLEEPVVAACTPVDLPVESVAVAQAEPEPIELSAAVVEQPAAAAVEPGVEAPGPELAAEVPALESDVVSEIELAGELDVVPAIEAVAAAELVELAPDASVAEVVSIEAGRTVARSPVPALERFLTKVQARRAQLMAESVA